MATGRGGGRQGAAGASLASPVLPDLSRPPSTLHSKLRVFTSAVLRTGVQVSTQTVTEPPSSRQNQREGRGGCLSPEVALGTVTCVHMDHPLPLQEAAPAAPAAAVQAGTRRGSFLRVPDTPGFPSSAERGW